MEYGHQLNELKRLILLKCGIKFITPADCKRISIEISRHLNKNVSETTIKRLFGFAVVKHKFSNFTLTTLAEYVDGDNLDQGLLSKTLLKKEDSWSRVKQKVEKITNFTLKTIRNRSGIPYEMTISRRFAEHDFDDFFEGNFVFTSLISQPGYGRTTLLSHLAENLFQKPNAAYKDSTLLFIKAYNFFTPEQLNLNLEDQLKDQLEIDPNENPLEFINRNQEKQGGKFIIILDGFAELVLRKDQKNQLFDSIINLICSLEDYQNIRLVMSMRSTTWIRFYERMRHSSFLKSAWYPGNYYSLHEMSNVPPLSEKEVDMIISKINYLNHKEINPKLKSQLKFPFHIQLYYQLKEEDPDFNYYSNITFYELVSRFIQEKIYRSNYYTEKILFLKKIIKLTSYGRDSNSVAKDCLMDEFATFKNAYMELLSDGILMEEKRFENETPKEYVRFLHTHMFEYFLFVEILEKFHLQINKDFFLYINTQYDSNQVRFQLLQWAIRFLIKTGNFYALKSIFKLGLINYEINYLILFIAEEIKYRSKYNPDMSRVLEDHNFHEIIIAELINFDFIDSCYREAATTLLSIATQNEHKLIYNSLLGILDILSFDKDGMKERIKNLNKIAVKPDWIVNPAEVIDIINARMNGVPIEHNDLLGKLEDLKNGIDSFGIKHDGKLDMRQGISFVLLLCLNFFTRNKSSTNKIIESIAKFRTTLFIKRNTFSVFMLNFYGISLALEAPGKKADQIEKILIHLSLKNNNNFTKYQDAILLIMQSVQSLNRKQYELASTYGKEALLLFKRNEMIYNALRTYDILIKIAVESENIHLANEYKYEKLYLMDEFQVPKNII